MSIQYPKPKGGISPASPSRIHIYRDPPKAITTRKYEPINVGDIMYMVRADAEQGGDASRINEGIQYYARGQNSMVEVDYGNHSAGSMNTSLHNGQASNPYKIEVVRPPLYPVETLVPVIPVRPRPRADQDEFVKLYLAILFAPVPPIPIKSPQTYISSEINANPLISI